MIKCDTEGAEFIANPRGTAPGLICPVGNGDKVIYAVPGVPGARLPPVLPPAAGLLLKE